MACYKAEKPNFAKNAFFMEYKQKGKRLEEQQRKYKKILQLKIATVNEINSHKGLLKANRQLREEKDILRAKIWVADGTTYKRENDRHLQAINCHVNCQVQLYDEIHELKESITHMDREVSRVTKKVYDLNRKIVPESQHLDFVARTMKKLRILENEMEVGVRRECILATTNKQLREQFEMELNHRTFFGDIYTKLVQRLNSERKYLIELTDYALSIYDNCIENYEKITNIINRENKDVQRSKNKLQKLIDMNRKHEVDASFAMCKVQNRVLADLQPKEYRRRELFRKRHQKKINSYNKIIDNILECTNTKNYRGVLAKFKEQAELYHSYFAFSNEMGYKITLLNNSISRLFDDINYFKNENRGKFELQLHTIEQLEKTLKEKRQKNDGLQTQTKEYDTKLKNLYSYLDDLFEICNLSRRPLWRIIGDHRQVNIFNMKTIMKLLEDQLNETVACVFLQERKDLHRSAYMPFVVNENTKRMEYLTHLDEIVVAQQCAECGEGEVGSIETTELVQALTIGEAREIVREKITQPELQYHLHSISSCRLPRSRMLAAKMNM